MSGHDNEELIDYEDEHDVVAAPATAATNGTASATATATDGEGDKDKKNFSGIHSTGFRCVKRALVNLSLCADTSHCLCPIKGFPVEARAAASDQ